jgi:hypothetical protein
MTTINTPISMNEAPISANHDDGMGAGSGYEADITYMAHNRKAIMISDMPNIVNAVERAYISGLLSAFFFI